MRHEEARRLVVDTLMDIAPDLEESELDAAASLRDGAELDSMDFVAFIAALSEAIGRDIPEDDYSRLDGIDAAVTYLTGGG